MEKLMDLYINKKKIFKEKNLGFILTLSKIYVNTIMIEFSFFKEIIIW